MKSTFPACCMYVTSYFFNSNPIVLMGVAPAPRNQYAYALRKPV